MDSDNTEACLFASPASRTAVAAELRKILVGKFVIPITEYPLAGRWLRMVSACLPLEAFVKAGVPAAFPFKCPLRAAVIRMVISRVAGAGGAEGSAAGTGKALDSQFVPCFRGNFSFIEKFHSGFDV